MKIVIETIHHNSQRYDTVGDWWIDPDGSWQIRVSEMVHDAEFLVALHELVEMAAALHNGCTVKQLDDFDMKWKPHDGINEPGDDPSAPYYHEHQLASGIERLMSAELRIDWVKYVDLVESLDWQPGT